MAVGAGGCEVAVGGTGVGGTGVLVLLGIGVFLFAGPVAVGLTTFVGGSDVLVRVGTSVGGLVVGRLVGGMTMGSSSRSVGVGVKG